MNRRNSPRSTPLSRHDHEWRPVEESPIFEDGAAIFREECNWAEVTGSQTSERLDETFYSYGAECEETRSYRMEEVWIERKKDDSPNIRFFRDSVPFYDEIAEKADCAIYHSGHITDIDPDPDDGHVVVESDNWRIRYEA